MKHMGNLWKLCYNDKTYCSNFECESRCIYLYGSYMVVGVFTYVFEFHSAPIHLNSIAHRLFPQHYAYSTLFFNETYKFWRHNKHFSWNCPYYKLIKIPLGSWKDLNLSQYKNSTPYQIKIRLESGIFIFFLNSTPSERFKK